MAIEVHLGTISVKDSKNLIMDMHWNAKKLRHQAAISTHLVKEIKGAIKDLIDKKTKEKKKKMLIDELKELLKDFEYISLSEERKALLSVKEAATAEKDTIKEMKQHISGEVRRLLGLRSIPKSYARAIFGKASQDISKIRRDVKKQGQIALEVKEGSISATLKSMGITTRREGRAAKRMKVRAFKAKEEWDILKDIGDKLKEDEAKHEIDKIKDDLIEEAEDYEKEIHYVYLNLLYCLLFMSYIEKRFKDLEKAMEKGKKVEGVFQVIIDLENKLKKIREEWDSYMSNITTVLQQLRFSVVPAEASQIAKG
ncbi:hypothetical protein KY358_01940 [Candidatus Woesearchaeota archaeon]|nr:hypothetical protein [Candidatus Woesearchaeota archaeon]